MAFDRRRPRWLTELVDRPLYCHWGAGAIGTPLFFVAALVLAAVRGFEPGVLRGVSVPEVAAGSYAAGLVLSGWAIWVRARWPRVRRYELRVSGLASSLEGFRIVHLSDLHLGNFAPRSWGRAWVEMANQLGADAIAVTGDLVVSGTDFYPDVADVLSGLRARHGVFVCLGNHDQWDEPKLVAELEARELRVLKNTGREVQHDGECIFFAGIDDLYTRKGDLDAVMGLRGRAPMVLLAHYPNVGEDGARQGAEVSLSGHTHGGQIGVPFLGRWINVATLSGQHGAAAFDCGAGTLVVSAGLGTTGPPMRIGVPPEIGLVVLRAA